MRKSNSTGKFDHASNRESREGRAAREPGDRVSQGFELIFGEVLDHHRDAMDRIEAEAGGRLESLERDAGHKAAILAALQDKAAATLEREDGEQRRRRIVEGDLRESIARLTQTLADGLDELRKRTDELEQNTARELAELREDRSGDREKRGLEQLRKAVGRLAATKLDRADLVSLLASFSHAIAAADEADSVNQTN